MSLEEFENTPDNKTKRYVMMRSITDLGMGFIYLAVGIVILFAKQFNFSTDFTASIPAKIFAVLVIIYGSWRIFRGIRKKYYKE
jgi:cell division protein FtsW (lipid II flippase)